MTLTEPASSPAPTLDDAPAGVAVLVTGSGADPALARRLAELGVRPGAVVVPLGRTAGGARVVAVDDARLALARRVLRRVGVEPVPHAGGAA
ncbi:MAG: ferrous iron transport protein A [Frankiales bacterium]|nr:ferrous iron transport protein A [Frankiales bacterium]